jgi:hypothetical protein
VLTHDSGKQAGKHAGPGGVIEHFVGRCLEKIAQKMLAVPVADGQLRSPPVNPEVVIVPRVDGRAQKCCLPSSEAALWPWVGEWGGGDLWGDMS